MKELNTRFRLRQEEIIQTRPSFWDTSGVYFIYWQQETRRWAICDLKCLDAVKQGQCPGWAYRNDSGFVANAAGWMEMREGNWLEAKLETTVVGVSVKGLKVELRGFMKQELNGQYMEKPSVEIQGHPSYWEPSGNYFIYWQSSMHRWAICDALSLPAAKSGLAPGWAYRSDSHHFAKASSWMEADGRDWQPTQVTCQVLEGLIRNDPALVKAEPGLEDAAGTQLSMEQYHTLIRQVYERKNPEKLADLDHLLVKYQGKESELFSQACTKYEVDAEELAASLQSGGVKAMRNILEREAAPTSSAVKSEAQDGLRFTDQDLADVPALSSQGYAILVQKVYEQFKPEKLSDLARLLQKHRGKEKDLYLEVCQKYGQHPAKFHAQQKKEQQMPGGDAFMAAKLEPTY